MWNDETLSMLTLEPAAVRYDRQVLEVVLAESGARTAYVGSWDGHHVATFGAFATGTSSQAYQFRLMSPDDLREPVADLEIRSPEGDDLDLAGVDRLPRRPRRATSSATRSASSFWTAARPASPCTSRTRWSRDVVSIGMYVDPVLRRRGVGSSILSLTARAVLDDGRTPVAGCWWKNWSSRATIEAAGLVCAGTIFRFDLDPGVFAGAEVEEA